MKPSHLLILVAVGLLAMPLSARERNEGRVHTAGFHSRSGQTVPNVETCRLRAWLNKQVSRVSWDDAPLAEVLDWLKAQRFEGEPINIFVVWWALEAEGVDRDSAVSLDLENVTIKEVLDLVLLQLPNLDRLTYEVRGSILIISTRSHLEQKLYTRLYDASDVLIKLEHFSGALNVSLGQPSATGGGGSRGQAQVQMMFEDSGESDGQPDDDAIAERGRQLVDWIQTVVEPNSWFENGGQGTMAVFDGQLAVRNTARVHRMLIGVLRLDE
jgi:hypothetical protein